MKNNIDFRKIYCKIGDKVPVYPYGDKVQPFIGLVTRITINKYGRVSYIINDRQVMAEELLPAKNQTKLKMRVS